MRLGSKPPEIIYVSVDQARFRNRFPNIPEGFPDNTVPILPFSTTKQITCLPNRKFSVKITQIPIAPAIPATSYKIQGMTCEAVISYTLNEPGRQNISLYVVAYRVTKFKRSVSSRKINERRF